MRPVSLVLHAVFACALLAPVSAQARVPVQDGIVSDGEYSHTETRSGIQVWTLLSADGSTLYLAARAPTKGWIAVGLGSSRMNDASIILGYVLPDGKQVVHEEAGKGHSHAPNAATVATVALRETDAGTILEAALPARGFLKDGKLSVIAAYGARDDRTSIHRARASFSFTLR